MDQSRGERKTLISPLSGRPVGWLSSRWARVLAGVVLFLLQVAGIDLFIRLTQNLSSTDVAGYYFLTQLGVMVALWFKHPVAARIFFISVLVFWAIPILLLCFVIIAFGLSGKSMPC